MSQALPAAASVSSIDWTVVATGAAIFVSTVITTVWGWTQAKKKVESQISPDNVSSPPIGAIIQDSKTVHEATIASRELRDQLLLLNHHLPDHLRALEDNTKAIEAIVDDLRGVHRILKI